MKLLLLLALAMGLTACATQAPGTSAQGTAGAAAPANGATVADTIKDRSTSLVRDAGLVQTATQPLNDLNLVRNEIPPVLLGAQKNPYAEPVGHSCTTVAVELQALDAALDPGGESKAGAPADSGPVQKAMGAAVDAVGQATVGTVKNTVHTVVDGVIPFRSWVRKLSGAEEHSGTAAAALQAGVLRRAYLKGWAEGTGCNKASPPKPDAATAG